MKTEIKFCISVLVMIVFLNACKKMETGTLNTGNFTDTSGTLKSAASFPIGFAIENNLFMNNSTYRATVVREASSVTFSNEMKHGSIVQSDGSFNFTTADALFNAATSAGLTVYGHVLGWHSQQNAGYLKSFAGITLPAATELLPSGTFESGLTGWATFNAASGATIAANSTASDAHAGTGSMKVVNPVAHAGQQYQVQEASPLFTTIVGQQYVATYWVKAASAGGSIRLSTQDQSGGNAQYQGDQTIGTSYALISWTFTANTAQTRIMFDMVQAANTYYIDDASVKQVVAAPSGSQVSTKVDAALNSWITGMVSHYAGKVKAWDVINELFTDNGNIRNNSNTVNTASDVFVWSEYLGRDYALKAFTYAKAADPTALLFINDYNLETPNNPKLDSLIAFVKELQTKGAKVDGIGTQMHTNINATHVSIDNMFQKLAATGLKVRISELDVRINPTDKLDITATPTESAYQASMYKYIVSSYMKNVPAAQQYGITVWGVDDATSWIITSLKKTDYPLLFDKNFAKKPAYAAFLQALKGQ